MLAHARAAAAELELPCRVIRRDRIRGCGPLGGIFTALSTSQSDVELFLACDMPFVSRRLLRRLLRRLSGDAGAVFTDLDGLAGFPFALRIECLPMVERQLRAKKFSLQELAGKLKAIRVPVPAGCRNDSFNVNAPPDLDQARTRARQAKRK
ncbi:MAG: molybdenum cofactor guanylyltransferase [Verrucomicrobiota bacterium]|jgi:molybdopterin-guanine dinucleotide biosynthesis protein A